MQNLITQTGKKISKLLPIGFTYRPRVYKNGKLSNAGGKKSAG